MRICMACVSVAAPHAGEPCRVALRITLVLPLSLLLSVWLSSNACGSSFSQARGAIVWSTCFRRRNQAANHVRRVFSSNVFSNSSMICDPPACTRADRCAYMDFCVVHHGSERDHNLLALASTTASNFQGEVEGEGVEVRVRALARNHLIDVATLLILNPNPTPITLLSLSLSAFHLSLPSPPFSQVCCLCHQTYMRGKKAVGGVEFYTKVDASRGEFWVTSAGLSGGTSSSPLIFLCSPSSAR